MTKARPGVRDAANFWGLGTRATTKIVCAKPWAIVRQELFASAPHGENMNRGAMLANDYNHFAAHSGGAVSARRSSKPSSSPALFGRLIVTRQNWSTPGALAQHLQQHDVKKKKTKYGHGEAWGALNNLNWRSTDIRPAHILVSATTMWCCGPAFSAPGYARGTPDWAKDEFKGTVVHFNAGGEWLDTFFNLGIKGNAVFTWRRRSILRIECSHFFMRCRRRVRGLGKRPSRS